MALVLPAPRADVAMAGNDRYRAAAPLTLPMAMFAGRADKLSGAGRVQRRAEASRGRSSMDWGGGRHFFVSSAWRAPIADGRRDIN